MALQTSLSLFFDLPEREDWLIEYYRILKKIDPESMDIAFLIKQYESNYKNDLDSYINSLLICSMLLKSKTRRLFYERDNNKSEEGIKEIKRDDASLDDFLKQISIFEKKRKYARKRYKKKHYVVEAPKKKISFKDSIAHIEKYFSDKRGCFFFTKIKKDLSLPPELSFFALLYLASDGFCVLEQKEQYSDFIIKR